MNFDLSQYSNYSLFFLRLVVAVIFIYHAIPKLKNAAGMSKMMGMPSGMIFMLGVMEVGGALGLLLGILVPISAFLLAAVMVGAMYFKITKWHVPFGAMDKTGWEFDLILLATNIFLLVNGGGAIGLW